MPRLKTHEEYVAECRVKDYDLPVDRSDNRYYGATGKLDHECRECGFYYPQNPNNHLDGQRCSKCYGTPRHTDSEFRQICKDRNYDPPVDSDENRYTGRKCYLWFICRRNSVHTAYQHEAGSHLSGVSCPDCGGSKPRTDEEYRRECEALDRDLSVDRDDNRYKNRNKILLHVCGKDSDHPPYPQRPYSHLQGQGCPNCRFKTQGMLLVFLLSLGLKVETEKWFEWTRHGNLAGKGKKGRPRRFDFFLPELNLIIELDGGHHFRVVWYSRINHEEQLLIDCRDKMLPALQHGYSILRIPQTEYYNQSKLFGPILTQILRGHDPQERSLLMVGRDLSIYDQHLELTTRLYENPSEVVSSDDLQEEGFDNSDDEQWSGICSDEEL